MDNKQKYFIGIDPGLTGAVCVLDDNGNIYDIISNYKKDGWIDHKSHEKHFMEVVKRMLEVIMPISIEICFEKPFQKQFQKETEKIWRNYERLFLTYSTNINTNIEIRPQEWKKGLGITSFLKEIRPLLIEQLTTDFNKTEKPKKDLKKYIKNKLPKLQKKESVKYQFENICPKDYDWYKTTKTGKKSVQLDDGKIDAYCIAKYLYDQN